MIPVQKSAGVMGTGANDISETENNRVSGPGRQRMNHVHDPKYNP